jgi:hypothetical protein
MAIGLHTGNGSRNCTRRSSFCIMLAKVACCLMEYRSEAEETWVVIDCEVVVPSIIPKGSQKKNYHSKIILVIVHCIV